MAESTTIEWTRNDDGTPGRTWNPVTGCTKISAGCTFCYAETIAERFRGHAAFPKGFDVQIRADKVNDPLKWRKPTRVFVNSMSDLFHDEVNKEWIAEIFAVVAVARQHTFQLLTKRHGRMRSLLNDPAFIHKIRHRAQGKGMTIPEFTWPLPNLWLGVSVENQKWANIRIPALLQTPAAVRFLSCEPLLGPVDLKQAVIPMGSERGHGLTSSYVHAGGCCENRLHGLDWVISGGESGRNARPAHPDWFRTLRDQCAAAAVAYFHKQHGEWAPRDIVPTEDRRSAWDDKRVTYVHPADGRTQSHGQWGMNDHRQGWACVQRVGKKAAGRELDGVTHDAFPEPT